ncbi:MAG: hypothetical protein LBS94_05095, partial [Prevotellaceae bacterium]|nr:hypothetical protein [Prevotellaceae bacterium]
MKKYVFALAAAALLSLAGYAQDEVEGLRFSRTLHQGTARFSSMGGAFAALGGDLTTMSFNPAGLGVYRASEFAFTPALQFSSTNAAYMGSTTTDSRYQMMFSNIGGVCVLPTFSDGLVS